MIIPSNRLLAWFGLAGVPLMTLAGLGAPVAGPAATVLVAFLLLILIDASRGRSHLGVLTFHFPEKVHLTEGCEGMLRLRVRQSGTGSSLVLLGFAWPDVIASSYQVETVIFPEGAQEVALQWPMQAQRRGSYFIEEYYTGCTSPLGFWIYRRRNKAHIPVSVYPNLRADRQGLEAAILRGRDGILLRRQIGRGREFEKLRDYIPGDSFADIHWKVTARRARPVTKLYQIERTQEVYVVIDTSRMSAQPVVGRDGSRLSALDRSITAALLLGLVTQRQKDHFGVIAFADKMRRFVRAGSGLRHYHACRDALYSLESQSVAVSFEEVMTQIRLRLRKRALLLFLTSLDDPTLAESFSKSMELICRQHLVVAGIFSPPHAQPVFAGEPIATEADIYRRLAGHEQWHQLAELERALRQRNVKLFQMSDEATATHLVQQYLEVKRTQRL